MGDVTDSLGPELAGRGAKDGPDEGAAPEVLDLSRVVLDTVVPGGGPLALFVTGWFGIAFRPGRVRRRGGQPAPTAPCQKPLLDRTNATRGFLFRGVMVFGAALGGALGARLSARGTLWVVRLGQLLVPLPLVLSRLRRVRDLPAPERPEPVDDTDESVSSDPSCPARFRSEVRREPPCGSGAGGP